MYKDWNGANKWISSSLVAKEIHCQSIVRFKTFMFKILLGNKIVHMSIFKGARVYIFTWEISNKSDFYNFQNYRVA